MWLARKAGFHDIEQLVNIMQSNSGKKNLPLVVRKTASNSGKENFCQQNGRALG